MVNLKKYTKLKYSKKSAIKSLSRGHLRRSSGRSKSGNILVRSRGGGVSVRYRIVDFYRGIWNVNAVVVGIEYTTYRRPPLACVSYSIGVLSYILLIDGLRIGSIIKAGLDTKVKYGSSSLLLYMPINRYISLISMTPGGRSVFSRGACTYSKIVKKKRFKFYITLKSGAVKQVSPFSCATYGIIYKPSFKLNSRIIKNAGLSRRLGLRPKVRGLAMNPVDHPHGGGEGKKSTKASPRNIWGFIFKNKKTAK